MPKKQAKFTPEEWRTMSAEIEASAKVIQNVAYKLAGKAPTRRIDKLERVVSRVRGLTIVLESLACEQLGGDEGMRCIWQDR